MTWLSHTTRPLQPFLVLLAKYTITRSCNRYEIFETILGGTNRPYSISYNGRCISAISWIFLRYILNCNCWFCVVKFWSSLWRGEYLLFISKPVSLDFHFLSTVLFSVFLEWTCLFLEVAIAIYTHILVTISSQCLFSNLDMFSIILSRVLMPCLKLLFSFLRFLISSSSDSIFVCRETLSFKRNQFRTNSKPLQE